MIKLIIPNLALNTKKADLINNSVRISFPYDYDMVEKIKTLEARKRLSETNEWTCGLVKENIELLIKWEFDIGDELRRWYTTITTDISELQSIGNIPGFKRTLYPFQKIGVEFIESRNGCALVADEMGLGKTIQAIAWLKLNENKDIWPCLITGKAIAKINWQRELLNSADFNSEIIYGYYEHRKYQRHRFNTNIQIVNYDILYYTIECKICKGKGCSTCYKKGYIYLPRTDILNQDYKTVILDEPQYINNSSAHRTKATKAICKSMVYKIGLTGTPMDKTIDLFNILNIIAPSMYPNYFKFSSLFFKGKELELHERLKSTIMIRRLMVDVLPDLPKLTRIVVPLELTNKDEYFQAEDNLIEWLQINSPEKVKGALKAVAFAKFEVLKQLAIKGKMKAIKEWIDEYLDTGNKLVVFTFHSDILEELVKEYNGEVVFIKGGMSEKKRQGAIDQFQTDDKVKIIICNIVAASESITLTAAHATATIELLWGPKLHDQAEKRVLRIGQESDKAFGYYLLAVGTVDERITRLIDEKRKTRDKVLDGIETKESDLLTSLINEYAKEKLHGKKEIN